MLTLRSRRVDEFKPLYGGATFLVLASGQVDTPSEGKVFRLDSFVDNSDGTYIGIYTPKYSGAFSLVLKRAAEQLQVGTDARRVTGCRLTHETRVQNVFDDVANTMDSAHHVIGCHLTHETRV